MTTKKIHAFTQDALGSDDAVAIAEKIKNKEISAKEVVEASIKRAEQIDHIIGGIEHKCFEEALSNSEFASQSNAAFAGVPTFVKDNTPIKGLPTNHGSAGIKSKPAKKHGSYGAQYLSQGFVNLGKSVLPEFGFNASTEPAHKQPSRNPWNIDFSTGASSGGSAALVAAGVVPIAHANDGGGSIRIPAACCGLVGLKPSRGRHVDSEMVAALPINIVSEGVVTRTVRDTAYFHAEAEKYYRNPELPPIGLISGPSKRRLRIGLVIDSVTGFATDKETRETTEKVADMLTNQGHMVETIPLPIDESFAGDFTLYWSMLSFLTQKTGKWSMDSSFDAKKLDGLTNGLANHYKKNFYKTPLFLRRLKKIEQQYRNVFKRYDVVLSPVLAHTTPEIGHLSPNVPFDDLMDRLMRYVSFTPLTNVSGGPAISLPMGVSKDGLPISMHFSADCGDEKTLIELAYELEELVSPNGAGFRKIELA